MAAPISWFLGKAARAVFTLATFLTFVYFQEAEARENTFSLSVQTDGSGTVTKNPFFNSYPFGAVVTLAATPSEGWTFSHWSGDVSATTNPLNVTVNGNKTIAAHFLQIPSYSLTVNRTGEGTILLDPPGGLYVSNTVVQISAQPADGWVLKGISGDISAGGTSIRMDAPKTISVEFVQKPIIVTAPQDRSVEIGDDVVFSVVASGEEPLTFQWSLGNTLLPGATNATLSLTDVGLEDEGTYTIRVSNPYGSSMASAQLILPGSCSGENVVTEPSEAALRSAVDRGGYVRLCFNGTVTLTQPIRITRNVTLDANERRVIISGNNATRLFEVQGRATFAAMNVTFVNGQHLGANGREAGMAEGGAILNQGGTVALTRCFLHGNRVYGGSVTTRDAGQGGHGMGGAIANHGGTLFFYSTILSNNFASAGRGTDGMLATTVPQPSGESIGGGIATIGGRLTLVDSILVRNVAFPQVDQLGSNVYSGTVKGAAIYSQDGELVIRKTSFVDNTARASGSLFALFGSAMGGGSAFGGAIYATNGTCNIEQSAFVRNMAQGGSGSRGYMAGTGEGGAIYNGSQLVAKETSFDGNKAISGAGAFSGPPGRGGAIYNVNVGVLAQSALYRNLAETGGRGFEGGANIGINAEGGAIFNRGSLNLTNNTIALNEARSGAGSFNAPHGNALGGGLYNLAPGSISAMNVTIASNTLSLGATLYEENPNGSGATQLATAANIFNAEGASFRIKNSIIAYPGQSSNVEGTLVDEGYNISSDASANFNSGKSFNFTDPRLLPLGNHGGLTWTMPLAALSPAINFGTAEGAPTIDQRGFARPYGSGVDIGAFESQPGTEPEEILVQISMNNANEIVLEFDAQGGAAYKLQTAGADFQWSDAKVFPTAFEQQRVRHVYQTEGNLQFFRIVRVD